MRERPILFSAPMVRAILAGRKTQTRRVVQVAEFGGFQFVRTPFGSLYLDFDGVEGLGWRPYGGSPTVPYPDPGRACPYGVPGDRLWVREAHGIATGHMYDGEAAVRYMADGAILAVTDERTNRIARSLSTSRGRPSIHMPRWASRISLEITEVRVQRIREITGEDAAAEGFSSRAYFASLWDSINAARGFPWGSNPWVWAITFRVLR